jgi:hypothetical protein
MGRTAQLYIWQHLCALFSFIVHPVHSTPEIIVQIQVKQCPGMLSRNVTFLEKQLPQVLVVKEVLWGHHTQRLSEVPVYLESERNNFSAI